MRLGDEKAFGELEVVSTGALSLDLALGIGGIPKGRIAEIQKRNGITSKINVSSITKIDTSG